MKTYMANSQTVDQKWYLIDANDKTLGRLASEIAKRLRGKHKPEFTPHVDTGDYLIVVNADKIRVTGNKQEDKIYYHHSGFPGGIKSQSFKELKEKDPCLALQKAVKGMLPRNALGRSMYNKLKVFAGSEHNHHAQQPIQLDIE